MSNRIRVTFNNQYPLVNGNCSRVPSFHVTRGCPRPGIFVEMLTLITNYLNLTVDYKVKSLVTNMGGEFDSIYNNETDLYAGKEVAKRVRKLCDF